MNSPPAVCSTTGPFGEALIDPVLEYDHSVGIAVIGGFVYRGSANGVLIGKYVFGDFSQAFFAPLGRLFYTDTKGPTAFQLNEFVLAPSGDPLGQFLFGFGEDESGELYVLASDNLGPTGNTGVVYRIVNARGEDGAVPTVSGWSLAILTLLLLTGAKVCFGRRQVEVAGLFQP